MNLMLIKAVAAIALVAGLIFAWNWHVKTERHAERTGVRGE